MSRPNAIAAKHEVSILYHWQSFKEAVFDFEYRSEGFSTQGRISYDMLEPYVSLTCHDARQSPKQQPLVAITSTAYVMKALHELLASGKTLVRKQTYEWSTSDDLFAEKSNVSPTPPMITCMHCGYTKDQHRMGSLHCPMRPDSPVPTLIPQFSALDTFEPLINNRFTDQDRPQ